MKAAFVSVNLFRTGYLLQLKYENHLHVRKANNVLNRYVCCEMALAMAVIWIL